MTAEMPMHSTISTMMEYLQQQQQQQQQEAGGPKGDEAVGYDN
jgi:hypothetical protein